MKAHLTQLSRHGARGATRPTCLAAAAPRCLAFIAAALCLGRAACTQAAAADTNVPAWLAQPMSLTDAIKLALLQNGNVLKSESDLEAAHGLVIQTLAIGQPQVRGAASYEHTEAVEKAPYDDQGRVEPQRDQWSGSIRVVQTIYEGGRIRSARRTARLTTEQALLKYQTVVADTLLDVRAAYYDALLAEQQIIVQEASVKLLAEQLEITRRRFEGGAVPRFDVLRGEVEVANARPRLIRAKNAHRIARNNLAALLGYSVPATIWEDIPMTLSDKLSAGPIPAGPAGRDGMIPLTDPLPELLAQALVRRPELGALRAEEALRKEGITVARSAGKPALGVFAAYGAHNSRFSDDFLRDIAGPTAGVQLNWNLWDGSLTRGRVIEATARHRKSQVDFDDTVRQVELQVRTAYSGFLEAREVLTSQEKVQEQAEEALRLATSRYEAGTGTQLDLLNAQTALTEARTTQIEALHRHSVARARLERATGGDLELKGKGSVNGIVPSPPAGPPAKD